jgi:hypothetical protein
MKKSAEGLKLFDVDHSHFGVLQFAVDSLTQNCSERQEARLHHATDDGQVFLEV